MGKELGVSLGPGTEDAVRGTPGPFLSIPPSAFFLPYSGRMRRAGLGKRRAEVRSSGAPEPAVLGAGARKEIRPVLLSLEPGLESRMYGGVLEAEPSSLTPFVSDPRGFL